MKGAQIVGPTDAKSAARPGGRVTHNTTLVHPPARLDSRPIRASVLRQSDVVSVSYPLYYVLVPVNKTKKKENTKIGHRISLRPLVVHRTHIHLGYVVQVNGAMVL